VDEAKATFEEARKRNLDGPFLRQVRYLLAFVQNDAATMQEQWNWAVGKPTIEDVFLAAQADTEAFRGSLSRARSLAERAADSAKRAGAPETAAMWLASEALREAELGDPELARRAVSAANALAPGPDVELVSALAYSRIDNAAQAEKLAEKLDHEMPLGTVLQSYWLPVIRASLALNRGEAQRAVDLLQATTPYETGTPFQFQYGTYYPVYVRGLAYLKLGQGKQAAIEFQKILDHRGIVLNFYTYPLASLGVARAKMMAGDTAGARVAYQDFLALWKDADPDIPVLKQAKAEHAKLQ